MSRFPFELPELHSTPLVIFIMLVMGFFAILFLQSGIDKIVDRKGNLEWLTGHFAKSAFARMVPALLTAITAMELLSGLTAVAAMVFAPFVNLFGYWLPFAAACIAGLTLLMLFMGQRIAKDYAGAAGIVPYFLVVIFSMLIFGAISAMSFY
jgi:diacylglycerol kinase